MSATSACDWRSDSDVLDPTTTFRRVGLKSMALSIQHEILMKMSDRSIDGHKLSSQFVEEVCVNMDLHSCTLCKYRTTERRLMSENRL
jgi:hypothetical protein